MHACLEEPPASESEEHLLEPEVVDDAPAASQAANDCIDKFREHYRRWQLSEGTGR